MKTWVKKSGTFGIVGLMLVFALATLVQADESMTRVNERGELVVGFCAQYPPFESKNEKTGEFEGFDVDLASGESWRESNAYRAGDEVVTKGAYSIAFAGRAVSLKEALDAAHGHPHNEDGSEMTKEQIAAAAAGGAAGHTHDHAEEGGALLWKITTGVLAALLVAQALMRKGSATKSESA